MRIQILIILVILLSSCKKEGINYEDILSAFKNGDDYYSTEGDAMWSWWNFPLLTRKNTHNNELIFSYTDKTGSTGIIDYNIFTNQYNKVSIKERILEVDDHNAGAIVELNDESFLTAFSESHSRSNKFFIYKSEKLANTNKWRKIYDHSMDGATTYSQILYINEKLYIFFRLTLPNKKFSWAMISSNDNGENWTSPKTIIYSTLQWYALFKPVKGNNNYIKFVHYSNPTLRNTGIRGGYIDISNNKVIDADAKTIIGNLGDYNNVEKFTFLIPETKNLTNRLYDLKITGMGNWNILYCTFSNHKDGNYKLYENGIIYQISEAGEAFYTPSKYYGGITYGNNNDIYLSRNTGLHGIYSIEKWELKSNKIIQSQILYTSRNKLIRPIYEKGVLAWLEGFYNPTDYKDFNTKIVLKDLL